MNTLALLGGKPVIEAPLKPYRSIGEEERLAVDAVMRTGHLSGYVGAWCDAFDGGPVVRDFETGFAAKFKSRHAIAVNSNTSGLIAAMGVLAGRVTRIIRGVISMPPSTINLVGVNLRTVTVSRLGGPLS